jgi:hypothetical protein
LRVVAGVFRLRPTKRGTPAVTTAPIAAPRDPFGTAAHRPLLEWGKQYILRPGMPVLEQNVDVANGKIRRLTLVQHPAQRLPQAAHALTQDYAQVRRAYRCRSLY